MASSSQNLLLMTDSYKVGHHLQYPKGTTRLLSYFEPRGGKFDNVIFFGLQIALKKWLTMKITMEMIEEADVFYRKHFPGSGIDIFNRKGWEYIVREHDGKLPLLVRAVREGTRVPVRNVLFTVENTDENTPWLGSYVESLLMHTWYPMTVCTNSFEQKLLLAKSMAKTCDNQEGLLYKLHDFGLRGATSVEAAGIGGCAHLVNFHGSDNVPAIVYANEFYPDPEGNGMPAISIPASEHSTMTTWGRDREEEAAKHIMEAFPNGLVSIVCDSYDIWAFIGNIVGDKLKASIEKRNGTLVIRPDSGDPASTVRQVLSQLETIFKVEMNSKGFKVLPSFIRVIQGDGISYESLTSVLEAMVAEKWSIDNITFGSGGALLQKLNRDTQKCAYKCCLAEIEGKKIDVFKNPITDPTKASKYGNLTLIRTQSGEYRSVRREELEAGWEDQMIEVFKNGNLLQDYTFSQIREKADQELKLLLQ